MGACHGLVQGLWQAAVNSLVELLVARPRAARGGGEAVFQLTWTTRSIDPARSPLSLLNIVEEWHLALPRCGWVTTARPRAPPLCPAP